MRLSGIANWQQPREGDCLPACAAMVLTYLNQKVDYQLLRRQLGTTQLGTIFSNIQHIQSRRLVVEYGQGNLETLARHLGANRPVIVAVATELLPYWITRSDIDEASRETEHAVVVVGLEQQTIYVNDPDFKHAPQKLDLEWFMAAWQHQQFNYAVIQNK